MDFALTEDQQILKRSARQTLSQECPTGLARHMEAFDAGPGSSLWRTMAELGWLGFTVPEEYGGCGGQFLDLTLLIEEMGRAILPGPFVAHSLSVFLLIDTGTEAQKTLLLPNLANGKNLVVPCVFSGDIGYSNSRTQCIGTVNDFGLIINGATTFVPAADVADYLILEVHTHGSDRGGTLHIIDGCAPGVQISRLDTLSGESSFNVTFAAVQVAPDSQLGVAGGSQRVLSAVAERGAVMRCAEMVGAAERVLEMTVEHANTRVQFGQPIGKFQAIQHHCANMSVDLESSRLLSRRAAWMVSEGIACSKEVAMAKAWVSEAYRRTLSLAHQVHGGVGLVTEHDLCLYSNRSFMVEAEFGDADFHREKVAQEIGL